MKIKISKSEVRRIGANIISNANDLHIESKKINTVLNDLAAVWQGADSTAFINVMKEEYLPNVEQVCKILEKQGAYLNKVPNVYDEVDISYSSKKIK